LKIQPSSHADNPLLGIPLAVKDLIDVAGIKTTAGSKFFSDRLPAEDAEVIRRIKLSGGCLLGKTNTHEIALGVTGVNPHYGAVKNPWNREHISGGSSSGSAVAVASGMCLAALGTDTGGSIRIPASLCGIVGLKPTRGRISTRGVMPLSWNLDHVGVLTRSVADAAVLLGVLAGYDTRDPYSQDIPGDDYLSEVEAGVRDVRIAIAVGDYIDASVVPVLAGVQDAGKVLKELGARVEQVDLSWVSDLAAANSRITQADAAAFHQERMQQHPDWFGEDVRQRLEMGAALPVADYIRVRQLQAEGRRRFELFFQEFDLLVLPTTPIPAPLIAGTGAVEAARQLTRFTSPFNLVGLPALSIPCGWVGGLPFGVQLVARPWDEAGLIRAGRAYERAISAGR
jgi:aspartyl-tRNA(Asn)/glutamyl-tRNA(Gln) amidotransferase subunit A